MSSAPHIAPAAAQKPIGSSLRARVRFNIDWITRPLFGVLLAAMAVGATILGGLPFMIFIALGSGAAVREWHRLFSACFVFPTMVTLVAMLAALLWQLYVAPVAGPGSQAVSLAFLFTGSLANFALGLWRREGPLAHAAGAFYIGLPTLTLLMLRQSAPHPIWLVVLAFLAVWCTDTGALLSGNLIGGPKLAPVLSPNKTWAGCVGGLVCTALIGGILALVLRVPLPPVALFGIVLSLAAQAGDLFESFIKRRVGRKDSGGLIPGHGGVLDRIDSILFAAPVAAFLVLVTGFDPLARLHP